MKSKFYIWPTEQHKLVRTRLEYSFGFFIYWHINFRVLFNAKAIPAEEQQGYYSIYSWQI